MTDTAAGRSVLFVIGNPRSGSTLVTMIAGSHPECLALGEVENVAGALNEQHRKARSTPCLCCATDCPVWDRADMRALLMRQVRVTDADPSFERQPNDGPFYAPIFEATGARVLVDSSKQVGWLNRRLAVADDWAGAEPRLLLATRDGRGAVHSWARKFTRVPFEDHVRKWLANVQRAEAAFDAFPADRRLRIAYEDVADAPQAAAERICGFLGLTPVPDMASYWTHPHHILRGNHGTISLCWNGGDHPAQPLTSTARRRFYADLGQAIRPDESWRTEMTPEQGAVFDRLAGRANAAYRRD
ncbi:hypothetical protein OCGS_1113 [Oceaniovalibus guishaninsula JLT2003]|uniref:Sulfotransferase n=1 Tax=Oceaniovalibus guishaninsula JLT2003 TaxID=1231392 RepID=K2I6W0_9RHOB|nr:sulfotransferase [Oceaniovalibus guishaninsula]EKE44730.1 hypothetical protein OCGS_1113 [Oceaniovalibus guishaninsula JLT2003]